MFNSVERILLTLWVGGIWIIGYVVAPTLFKMLEDQSVAGGIAGQLFYVLNYIGLVCGGLLIAGQYMRNGQANFKNVLFWVLVAMVVIVLISAFVLQPMMSELKAQGLTEATKTQFGRLHFFSAMLHMAISVLGLILVAFGNKLQNKI